MPDSGGGRELAVRRAKASDADLLASFECSRGAWFEDEVEAFIRDRALSLMTLGRQSVGRGRAARLLLLSEGPRLVAVCGHHPELLQLGDSSEVVATRLAVVAVARSDQGRVLVDGRRLSDVAMEAVILDALPARGRRVLTAIVATDNYWSISLCERHGLGSQILHSPGYVRLTGSFQRG